MGDVAGAPLSLSASKMSQTSSPSSPLPVGWDPACPLILLLLHLASPPQPLGHGGVVLSSPVPERRGGPPSRGEEEGLGGQLDGSLCQVIISCFTSLSPGLHGRAHLLAHRSLIIPSPPLLDPLPPRTSSEMQGRGRRGIGITDVIPTTTRFSGGTSSSR